MVDHLYDEMKKRYPRTLSAGGNNVVIALSEKEVGKLYTGDTRSDIGSEAEKMKFANQVNDLVVKFIRLDIQEEMDADMLVMERLYPLDFRAYEYGKKILFFDVFEDELRALHREGFVHRDLRRPSEMPGQLYDNIFLTEKGIRLIDVGISGIRAQVGDRLFDRFVEKELEELEEFRRFFLNR